MTSLSRFSLAATSSSRSSAVALALTKIQNPNSECQSTSQIYENTNPLKRWKSKVCFQWIRFLNELKESQRCKLNPIDNFVSSQAIDFLNISGSLQPFTEGAKY